MTSALRERPVAQARVIGGRLCLDLANTVGGWNLLSDEPRFEASDERLTEYQDLLAWSLLTHVAQEAIARRLLRRSEKQPREAAAVLDRARRLRDAIYRLGWRLARGAAPLPPDLSVLEGEVRVARARQRLDAAPANLMWRTVDDPNALDRPLWPAALSAEAYFTTGDLTRLRVCPGDDCGWLFEDQTRNRSRQWCEMGDCGNLAKVRRFRSRRAAGRGGSASS